jgi:hypothetical protein
MLFSALPDYWISSIFLSAFLLYRTYSFGYLLLEIVLISKSWPLAGLVLAKV